MRKIPLTLFVALFSAFSFFACGDEVTKNYYQSSDDVDDTADYDPYVSPVYEESNPPAIQNRVHTPITDDGLTFNDASGDGELQPYEDWRLSPADRAADLVARLDLPMKLGMLSSPGHSAVTADGSLSETDADYISITQDNLRYGLIRMSGKVTNVAKYHSNIQQLCQSLPWGIPYIVSADQSHGGAYYYTQGTYFSLWPTHLAFSAMNDPETTRKYAEIIREEYRAVGINMSLYPTLDVATEPRWGRVRESFGSSFDLTAIHGVEFIKGLQGGDRLVPGGVITCVKHFVGYGASQDGYDGHYFMGNRAVFPGDNFDAHKIPFEAAFRKANAAACMPCYPILEGQTDEEVSAGFSRELLTDVARGELGFTGFFTADWGIYNSESGFGTEGMSVTQRVAKSMNAGMDQLGNAVFASNVMEALALGDLTEERINLSVERIFKAMFAAGLFEDPYPVTPESDTVFIARSSEHWTTALDVMRKSFVLLENGTYDSPVLPAQTGQKIYFKGIVQDGTSANIIDQVEDMLGATLVTNVEEADVAIIRITGPSYSWYPGRDGNQYYYPSSGSLKFFDEEADSDYGVSGVSFTDRDGTVYPNAEVSSNYDSTIGRVYAARDAIEAAGSSTKLVVVLTFSKAWIVEEILPEADAIIGDFGSSDEALLDVCFKANGAEFTAGLPFAISRSNKAIEIQYEDLSDDDNDPRYKRGYGLTY